MLRVLLIRPGRTDFDDQGRIQGTLDIPMTDEGVQQVQKIATDLQFEKVRVIYSAPGLPARQTAKIMSEKLQSRTKVVKNFQNVDPGLWHGMLLEQLRTTQPRVYRMWCEQPDVICPPGGETRQAARIRLRKSLARLIRKHQDDETIAIVVLEPAAYILLEELSRLANREMPTTKQTSGCWNLIEVTETDFALQN